MKLTPATWAERTFSDLTDIGVTPSSAVRLMEKRAATVDDRDLSAAMLREVAQLRKRR